jgi:6-phosphogluconolactonase
MAMSRIYQAAGPPTNHGPRIQPELDPQSAARLYADDMRKFFHVEPGAFPHFDIIDQKHLAAAAHVENFDQWRITLLPGVLQTARNTIMLVADGDKAEPLRTVLDESDHPMNYPLRIVTQVDQNVARFLDKPAARLLH